MKPEIKYELWKNDVVQAARDLFNSAKQVGTTGIAALDAYTVLHHKLWEVMEREPNRK